jgi:hypothetical protein
MYNMQAPGVLERLNNIPVDMTLEGLNQFNLAQGADAMGLQNAQRQLSFDTQADPMRLASLGLRNQREEAELPGVRAQSEMLGLDRDKKKATHAQEIESMLGKFKAEDLKNHLAGVTALGSSMRNAAELIYQNPVGGVPLAKQLLARTGHDDWWSPEWDKLPPQELVLKLHEMGKAIQENGDKYSQALDTANIKALAAQQLQAQKAAAAQKLQQERLEAARSLKRWELENTPAKADKNTLEQLAARYRNLAVEARQDGDAEGAAKYEAEAARVLEEKRVLLQAGARVGQEGKPDVATMANLPTVAQPQQPVATPAPNAVAVPQTMAELKALYPGRSDAELKAAYKAKYGKDIK